MLLDVSHEIILYATVNPLAIRDATRRQALKKARKLGRPPSDNPMVHTAVVLPRELVAQLKSDGERSGRGLSGEIRHRLVGYGASDPETEKLLGLVRTLADSLVSDLGKHWYESNYARAAFFGGIAEFLGPTTTDRDIPGITDNPEAIGRTHARQIKRRGEERD